AGPGRFAADVDDVDAVGHHLLGLVQRCVKVVVAAAVRERIRRDIQYAHHQWTRADRIEIQTITAAMEFVVHEECVRCLWLLRDTSLYALIRPGRKKPSQMTTPDAEQE